MAITTYSELKLAVANWLGREELTNRIPEFIALAEDRIADDLRAQSLETQQVLKWKATIDGGTAGGTADIITLTPSSAASSYAIGDTYKFAAVLSNTSTVTINVSALGAKAAKRRHGGVKQGLSAGDIVLGAEYRIYYDGTDFLLVPPGAVPLPSDFVEQRRLYLDLSAGKPLDFFESTVFWNRNAVNESGQPDIYTIEGDYVIAAPVPDTAYYGRLLYYRRLAALSSASDTNWILANARGIYLYGALLEAYTYLEDDTGQLKYAALYDQQIQRANQADRARRYPRGAIPMRSQAMVV